MLRYPQIARSWRWERFGLVALVTLALAVVFGFGSVLVIVTVTTRPVLLGRIAITGPRSYPSSLGSIRIWYPGGRVRPALRTVWVGWAGMVNGTSVALSGRPVTVWQDSRRVGPFVIWKRRDIREAVHLATPAQVHFFLAQ